MSGILKRKTTPASNAGSAPPDSPVRSVHEVAVTVSKSPKDGIDSPGPSRKEDPPHAEAKEEDEEEAPSPHTQTRKKAASTFSTPPSNSAAAEQEKIERGSKRLSRTMRSLSGLGLKKKMASSTIHKDCEEDLDEDARKMKKEKKQKEKGAKKEKKKDKKEKADPDKPMRENGGRGEEGGEKHGKKNKGEKEEKKKHKKEKEGKGKLDKDEKKELKKAEKEMKAAAKKEEKRRAQMVKAQQSMRSSRMKSVKNLKQFGVPLRQVLAEHPSCCVPPFVEQACLYIEQVMLDVEGIFRKTGIKEECRKWRDSFNMMGYLDWGKVREHILIPDLLKLYLRELPDPILTYELYDCFMAKAKSFRTEDMLMNLRDMICLVPRRNLLLLKRLVMTLRMVREHAAKNLMDENNLGVIFGPNLLRAPADSKADLMTDFEYVNAITLSLIVDFDSLLGEVTYKPYYICHVRATQDYTPLSSGELLLHKGDVVLVTITDKSGWWFGELNGQDGRFPIHCCTFLDGTECIKGLPVLGVEPSTGDGRLPRPSRIVDASAIARLALSPRSPKQDDTLKKSPRSQPSTPTNTPTTATSPSEKSPRGSPSTPTPGSPLSDSREEHDSATENPHASPEENAPLKASKEATAVKGDYFAFG